MNASRFPLQPVRRRASSCRLRGSAPRGLALRAFTMIEILVVLGIIALLAAILLPVLGRAREAGRSASCKSNLHQLGLAMTQYTADYERYPRALDPSDRQGIWAGNPVASGVNFNDVPMLNTAMNAYVRSNQVWACPSDSGFDVLENYETPMPARPTCHQAFGMSYFYRTELTFLDLSEEHLPDPVNTNVLFDGHGGWHGSSGVLGINPSKRYNALFGDGHVKSLSYDQLQNAWLTRVR